MRLVWTTQDALSKCPTGFTFSKDSNAYYALAPSNSCEENGQSNNAGIAISNGNARISADKCATQMAGFYCSDDNTCCDSSKQTCSSSACSEKYVGVAADDGHCICITGVGACDSSNLKKDPHFFELKAPGVSASEVQS